MTAAKGGWMAVMNSSSDRLSVVDAGNLFQSRMVLGYLYTDWVAVVDRPDDHLWYTCHYEKMKKHFISKQQYSREKKLGQVHF